MKVFLSLLLPVVLSVWFLDCSHSKDKPSTQTSPVGDYQYKGFDKAGKAVVEGQLSIKSIDETGVKGEWSLRAIGNPEKIGPQTGTGTFSGQIKNDAMSINMNPNMADNNVNLSGKIEGGQIRGTWSYSGFAGEINRGTFEAKKK